MVGEEEFFTFRDEAIRLLDDAILKLEELRNSYSEEKLFEIYSDIHTVKGEVGFFGFSDVAEALHNAEDDVIKLKKLFEDRRKKHVGQKFAKTGGKSDFSSDFSDFDLEGIKEKLIFASSRLRAASSEDIRSVDEFSEHIKAFFQEYSSALDKRATFDFSINVRSVSSEFFSVVLRIVVTLIRNSLEHAIEPYDIRLKVGKPPEGRVEISIDEISEGVFHLIYRDDGAGFPPHILEKIKNEGFHAIRGVSTKPASLYSGRGMGLYSIYMRVKELGGNISLESQTSRGTTIKIDFRIDERLSSSPVRKNKIGDEK